MELIKEVLVVAGVIGLGLESFGIAFGRFRPGWGGACVLAAVLFLTIAVK